MIFARKPGKLPGEVIKQNYELEYGENTISLQKRALSKYASYSIVDDLIATGGTVKCVANLLKKEGKEITGLLTVVNLKELNSKNQFDFPVDSLVDL